MPNTRNGHTQETPTKEHRDVKNMEGDDDSLASEDETSSYDEEEAERKKIRCLDDMACLEQQFVNLKELLYQEKVQDVDQKIQLLSEDTAPEFQAPVQDFDRALQMKVDMAMYLHDCQSASAQNKFDQEIRSLELNFLEECKLVGMRMKQDIKDRIRRLQEERVFMEISAEPMTRKRKSKACEFLLPEKRKKPVTVIGPVVVHMLRDMDIMEDISDIRRGIAAWEVKWRHQLS